MQVARGRIWTITSGLPTAFRRDSEHPVALKNSFELVQPLETDPEDTAMATDDGIDADDEDIEPDQPGDGVPQQAEPRAGAPESDEPVTKSRRQWRIMSRHLKAHGYTRHCRGCEGVERGNRVPWKHTQACPRG